MSYILTFDVGTTSVKTCLFGEAFTLLGFSSEEYGLLTPGPNIVELDSDIYWEACKCGAKKVLKASGINAFAIGAITITTQGETLIPVDVEGRALRNAIVWLDARAQKEAEYIQEGFTDEEVYSVTGLPEVSGACPVSKVLWIKDNEPEVYAKVHKFLLLEDFLLFKLTGKFVSEKSLMSSTGYYDINKDCLWAEILKRIGVEAEKFPEILECGVDAGRLLPAVAEDLGFNALVVVATGAMDQVASAVGAANIEEGIITETTGTALVIGATTLKPDYSNPARISVYRHALKGKYLILPYCSTAGIVLKWFKDEFCRFETEKCAAEGTSVYEYLDALAQSVPALSNGLMVLPHFAGMLTPEINPGVRGVFFGAGLDTKKEHFIRAILESIAYMLRENIELLEAMGVHVSEIRSLGGGSMSPLWCRIKADINHKKIVTMQQGESTSLGAAILGGVAAGMFESIEEACQVVKVREAYTPDERLAEPYDKGYRSYTSLYKNLKAMF